MSEIIGIRGISPFGSNMHNQITRVDYKPKMYVFNEAIGLYAKWQPRDIYMISKLIDGPFRLEYEENGEIREKLRYLVTIWPETIYGPEPEIVEFLDDCLIKDCLHYFIHMYLPPWEVYQEMEKKAAAIYYKLKRENGGDNPTAANGFTTFELGELAEENPISTLEKIEGFVSNFLSKVFNRPPKVRAPWYMETKAETYGHAYARFKDVIEVKKCIKTIKRETEDIYVSNVWPWFLVETDMKKTFWKVMHRIMCYKKVTIEHLICDFDLKNFLDVNDMREEEILEMEAKILTFLSEARSL